MEYVGDENGHYNFESTIGTVIALRKDKMFVEEVDNGEDCGILLDRTCFYAESGGQIYDEGFMEMEDNSDIEFKVNNVQVKGGYVLHIGKLSAPDGKLRVGDKLKLFIDESRRRPVMSNHTGTHVLNFALRKVLGEADQRGSLVAPDKLRFDFSAKGAMTTEQIKEAEEIANSVIEKRGKVYAKDTPLAQAKSIQGLRAVFDEVYPDPVRVLSIGIPVEDLVADPAGPGAIMTSVEFCGGTHLQNSGDIGKFVITTEEAIAKGIRRIVAITGEDAEKSSVLQEAVASLAKKIDDNQQTQTVSHKQLNKDVTDLGNDLNNATIPQWRKDNIRNSLKDLKKKLDEIDKARKAAIIQTAKDTANQMITDSPDKPLVIARFEALSISKALDAALKQYKSKSPKTAAMLFSIDEENSKILCLAQVPKEAIAKGLKANEWVKHVSG
ncbi:putative alanine--tRNA ligase, cytoplasmic [Apostichopus japonicus]|uniref:alanine--tRNA ligase n=1 Tax=Stichopus japonicus TaxID=307972 RepID=A0A2G8L0V5_STIJA|nr:putative alanine--tRNA ligase, cytoplasmic [Apostichopus japonicus]